MLMLFVNGKYDGKCFDVPEWAKFWQVPDEEGAFASFRADTSGAVVTIDPIRLSTYMRRKLEVGAAFEDSPLKTGQIEVMWHLESQNLK
jgi:hypothetical protein